MGAMVSSGGSTEDREAVGVDFCGEPVLNNLAFRSGRPSAVDELDECCDWEGVVRAREDRLGSGPAMVMRSHGGPRRGTGR